jgi:hypothetical protein
MDPKVSSVALDKLATDGEPHAGTRYLSAVETLEEPKNRFLELRLNTNAIVADTENPLKFICSSRDLYARHRLGTVFNCVTDEVMGDLHDLRTISKRRWQMIARHQCSAFLDRCFQIFESAFS